MLDKHVAAHISIQCNSNCGLENERKTKLVYQKVFHVEPTF